MERIKNIFASRKGFTLIELLVVIGILAVLPAIAIPSVAGLIDRANKSADMTNANEMTNAIERFTSEYELYCQDIASKEVNLGDLDSAQGRVHNVTGISDRKGITALESETGFRGKGIDRDTKYPVNEDTLKAIIENYTKTSSATFEPKQSDCEFYYSPEAGVVIVGERGATIDTLNGIAFSSDDDIAQFDTINWICLDNGETDNVATDEQGTFGELDSGVQPIVIKTMTIDDVEYQYEEGMLWKDWIASKYNTANVSFDYSDVVDGSGKNIQYVMHVYAQYGGGWASYGNHDVSIQDEVFSLTYGTIFADVGLISGSSQYIHKHDDGCYYVLHDGLVRRYTDETKFW